MDHLNKLSEMVSESADGEAMQMATLGCMITDAFTVARMCDALEQIGTELAGIRKELRRIREGERRKV